MTPKQFLNCLKNKELHPAYLFLGNEVFFRDRCRYALTRSVLGESTKQTSNCEGLAEIDLSDQHLSVLIDEARAMSLFSRARLLIGSRADTLIPRGTGVKTNKLPSILRSYVENPTPGTVLLFEITSVDLDSRDDRARIDRTERFFGAFCEIVELRRLSTNQAVRESMEYANQLDLQMEPGLVSSLVETLGNDMGLLANELEKLSLYVGSERLVRDDDLDLLTSAARRRGVFEFSDALAHGDKIRALDVLDALAETGGSWPMQVNLIAGLFRQALAMQEAGAKTVQQIMVISKKNGIRMWPPRARQLIEIGRHFSAKQLEWTLVKLGDIDRDLRRERPNDRVIMEQLVISL